jgi:uncharacterized protein (DUF486 family)
MPALMTSPYVFPIVLLIGSNAFMTTAWYWHLRYKEVPLWQVILISWVWPSSNIAWRCRRTATAAPSIRRPS